LKKIWFWLYKHNEQINKQNIDNSECFGVKFVKIHPEMTSQSFFDKICFFYVSQYSKNQVNFFEGGSINKGEMVHVTIS
jgi:hypothetical protein